MMNTKSLRAALVFASSLAAALPTALAVPTTYDLNYGTDVAISSSSISRVPQGLAGRSTFKLDDGQTFKDNSFTIYLIPQTNSESNPGYADSKIRATVVVDDRAITFEGSVLFGQSKWGQILWSTPAQTFTENYSTGSKLESRTFTVDLTDELLYAGAVGERPSNGAVYGATVKALVTQIRSTPVPDTGSTALFMTLGVALIALFRKDKVATQAAHNSGGETRLEMAERHLRGCEKDSGASDAKRADTVGKQVS